MKWKVFLAASLLVLSIALTAVAVNQLMNETSTPLSETNGVTQSQDETSAPSIETEPTNQSLNETNGVNESPNEAGALPTETELTDQTLNETSTSSSEIEVEATQYPFKLTMTLDKTDFTLGEPVKITLRLKNIGNETLTLVFSDGSDRFSFIVYDETKSQVFEYVRYYAQVYIPTEVPPGKEGIATLTWYQETDSKGKAQPGIYYIFGIFISNTLDLTVKTPPIIITIVE